MTPGSLPRVWLLGCLPVTLAACDSAPDSALTSRSDSAGIPIVEIGDDYILGVWRDELDVEYVRMYGLEK